MHLVIFGPEGSGKGTQAKLLSKHFNLPIYTSGDLVRTQASRGSGKLGEACRWALVEGTYVSDPLMFELWENRLKTSQAKKGFIVDGFPRNENQAKFLMDKARRNGYSLDYAIYIKLRDIEAKGRLLLRNRKMFEGVTLSHDSAELITKRLATFRQLEENLVSFFKKMGILLTIDGQQNVSDVHNDIITGLITQS